MLQSLDTGVSTWLPWIICARVSTCAAMPEKTKNSRAFELSGTCFSSSAPKSPAAVTVRCARAPAGRGRGTMAGAMQYHHADYDEALATANPDRDVQQPQRIWPR